MFYLQAISHLLTWRGSDNQITIGSLLVKLWRQEETAMGVQRDENGVILGTMYNHDERYALSSTCM